MKLTVFYLATLQPPNGINLPLNINHNDRKLQRDVFILFGLTVLNSVSPHIKISYLQNIYGFSSSLLISSSQLQALQIGHSLSQYALSTFGSSRGSILAKPTV